MMTKTEVQRVVRNTVNTHCKEEGITFNRDMKWAVFLNVVDSLLDDGRITKQQHHKWTNPF